MENMKQSILAIGCRISAITNAYPPVLARFVISRLSFVALSHA